LFKALVDEPDGDLPATLFLFTEEGIRIEALPPFTNFGEKSHIAGFVIPSLVRASGARVVGFASACWYAPMMSDKPLEEQPAPSEHPDRREIISLYLTNVDKAVLLHTEIRRRPDKRPLLTPWTRLCHDDSSAFEGRFVSSINDALEKNLSEGV
jgi:hypothetical protein